MVKTSASASSLAKVRPPPNNNRMSHGNLVSPVNNRSVTVRTGYREPDTCRHGNCGVVDFQPRPIDQPTASDPQQSRDGEYHHPALRGWVPNSEFISDHRGPGSGCRGQRRQHPGQQPINDEEHQQRKRQRHQRPFQKRNLEVKLVLEQLRPWPRWAVFRSRWQCRQGLPNRRSPTTGQREIGVGLGMTLCKTERAMGSIISVVAVLEPHTERRRGCHETSNQPTGIAPCEDQHREGKTFCKSQRSNASAIEIRP